MNVIKRNGNVEPLDINKIYKMLQGATKHLTNADYFIDKIINKITLRIKNNIHVKEIQEQLINVTVDLIDADNTEFSLIAGKLLMSQHIHSQPLTNPKEIYLNGVCNGLYEDNINLEQFIDILNHVDIKKSDNYKYNYSSTVMWIGRYLQENETPAIVFAFIASTLSLYKYNEACDNAYIFANKIYRNLADNKLSLATPFLMNLRLKNGNLSSCFTGNILDSMVDIYDSIKDFALISKNGGGQGLYLGDLRAKGSMIKGKYGLADSVIPVSSVLNQTAIFSNQNGKRAGAITLSLPTYHADILEFLELQTESGDSRRKAFDIFPQLIVDNYFMYALEKDLSYPLVCPHEVKQKLHIDLTESTQFPMDLLIQKIEDKTLKVGKIIRARNIFKSFISALMVKGTPYIAFKDNIETLNPAKDIGTIKTGNLCVTGDTLLLTKQGNIPIEELAGQTVECWNGQEWSLTPIFRTDDGSGQEVMEVKLLRSQPIRATPYHRWLIHKGVGYDKTSHVIKETRELTTGDRILKHLPCRVDFGCKRIKAPYESGFLTADGSEFIHKSYCSITFYTEKKKVLLDRFTNYSTINTKANTNDYGEELSTTLRYKFGKLERKFFVPDSSYSLNDIVSWLEGVFDGDGCLVSNNNAQSIQLTSINLTFLYRVQSLLTELGIYSSVVHRQPARGCSLPKNDGTGEYKEYMALPTYLLTISGDSLNTLLYYGYNAGRVLPTHHEYNRASCYAYNEVVSVQKVDGNHATYCGTEPKLNRLVFNNTLTMNCMESFSVTNEKYTHVCNLMSLVLPNIKDEELEDIVKLGIEILNLITSYTTYPTEKALNHAKDFKVIGLGAIGLHDWLAYNKLTYDDIKVIETLFEKIALYSHKASIDLTSQYGKFYQYEKSEFNKGIILGHTLDWFKENSNGLYKEWEEVFNNLHKNGIANLQLNAYMPSTSTSILMGVTAGMLPIYSKFFYDTSKLGSLPIFPRYLKDRFWYYKDYAYYDLIKMNTLIGGATKWIDTGISYEVVINLDETSIHKILEFYLDAWKKGIKTIYYVRWIRNNELNSKNECISCAN